ncbi:MAG: HTTM domain-containing protein [Actinomycetota bacterium]
MRGGRQLLEWIVIAFSYGKVDHDRFAFLVALAVLPTVGRISWNDESSDEKAAWAIRCIQIAVVATYFLSTFAKFRFGGFDWVNGATLLRAVLRRGTDLAAPLETAPELLRVAQWGIVVFELASPLLLTRGRIGRLYLASAFLFHAVTYATIRIVFWPHVACLLAFLPLEKLRPGERVLPVLRERSRWRPSTSRS